LSASSELGLNICYIVTVVRDGRLELRIREFGHSAHSINYNTRRGLRRDLIRPLVRPRDPADRGPHGVQPIAHQSGRDLERHSVGLYRLVCL
jgi:hypothetical protein